MKTLDDVIEGMQLTGEVNRHYREKHADVLHYLRMYQSALKALDENQQVVEDAVRQRDKHIKALAELAALREYWAKDQENPPLTWEELTGMVGQPVWVEYNLIFPMKMHEAEAGCGLLFKKLCRGDKAMN